MGTTRQEKVSRLIQKELGNLFVRIGKMHMQNTIISANIVRISPDLGVAKVYLSVFPSNKVKEALELIAKNKSQIRYELGRKIRNQLKVVPELIFYHDDSIDYIEKIDNLLKE